jgi:hypothetical protein
MLTSVPVKEVKEEMFVLKRAFYVLIIYKKLTVQVLINLYFI